MRGDLIFEVLKALRGTAALTTSMVNAVISNYYKSYRGGRDHSREETIAAEEFIEKQKFYSILYYLQKQKLVSKKKKKDNTTAWFLTKKGEAKWQKLSVQSSKIPFLKQYPLQKSEGVIVVVFDVPEIYKCKRNWLRAVLRGLEYQMVQKSVWIGENSLPSAFLEDLKDYDLMPYVQVFSIPDPRADSGNKPSGQI